MGKDQMGKVQEQAEAQEIVSRIRKKGVEMSFYNQEIEKIQELEAQNKELKETLMEVYCNTDFNQNWNREKIRPVLLKYK